MDTQSKIDKAKGRAEQAIGDISDDDELKAQGQRHETGGKLKEKVADVRDRVDHAIDDVEEGIDRISKSNSSDKTAGE